MNKKYSILFYILGVAAILIMIYNLGWATLIDNLKKTSWFFIPIVLLRLVIYPINMKAWQYVSFYNKEERKQVPMLKMFQMTISGYAINYLTPVMALGGEPYRIMAMKKYVGGKKATSSVLMYAIMHILSHFVFWTIGCILILSYTRASHMVNIIAAIFIFISLICILFITRAYKHGVVVSFFRFAQKIPFLKGYVKKKMTDEFCANIKEVDSQIRDLYQNHRSCFYKSLTLETLSRFVGCFELLFIFFAIGVGSNLSVAETLIIPIIISAETTLFANLLFFAPMQLGTREGGLILALKSIGLPSKEGVFMGIVMRISELIWIIIGMLLIRLTTFKAKQKQ